MPSYEKTEKPVRFILWNTKNIFGSFTVYLTLDTEKKYARIGHKFGDGAVFRFVGEQQGIQ